MKNEKKTNRRGGDLPPEENTDRRGGDLPPAENKNPAEENDKPAKKLFPIRLGRKKAEPDDIDSSYATDAPGFSNEEHRRRQNLRDLLKIGCIVLAVLAVIGAGVLYYNHTIVKTIRISGSEVYGEAQLLSMSGIRAGKNIYLYKEEQLRADMNSIHDIRTESVTKIMPDTISIVVSDITPAAAIRSPGGLYTLISSDGYVLSMGEASNRGLLTIEGMSGTGYALNTFIDRNNTSIRTVGAVSLIRAIGASTIAGKVLSIDLSNSACVSILLENNYKIVLGSISTAPECIETAARAYERFLPVYPNGGTVQVFRGSSIVDFTPAD
ncbi:MAG: FtsQ-type POTRA domain-containing protein [Clostridia bacterium]|nr:FtsQ-type POTRA domain-containing protein [Clostridia bacterium]